MPPPAYGGESLLGVGICTTSPKLSAKIARNDVLPKLTDELYQDGLEDINRFSQELAVSHWNVGWAVPASKSLLTRTEYYHIWC